MVAQQDIYQSPCVYKQGALIHPCIDSGKNWNAPTLHQFVNFILSKIFAYSSNTAYKWGLYVLSRCTME